MTVAIAKWDTAEVLNTRERVVAYLDAVLADGDPEMLKLALGNIARAAASRPALIRAPAMGAKPQPKQRQRKTRGRRCP
jgi:probable addiction module antidote protein